MCSSKTKRNSNNVKKCKGQTPLYATLVIQKSKLFSHLINIKFHLIKSIVPSINSKYSAIGKNQRKDMKFLYQSILMFELLNFIFFYLDFKLYTFLHHFDSSYEVYFFFNKFFILIKI